MGAAVSSDAPPADAPVPSTTPDALLGVLDRFAHDARTVERLVGFLDRHCEFFFARDEQSLACTQVHQNYQQLFESLLSD
eukprot:289034-Prymnesium_polylepis.1